MKTQGSLYMLRGLLFGLFFITFYAKSAIAQPYIESWQNRTGAGPGFSIGPKVTFFNSTRNYDLNSQSVLLGNDIQVQRYYIDINFSYGFDENFFLFGRFSGLYTSITGVGLYDQTNFGLNDQMIGGAYRIFQNNKGLSINLQGEITIPAYANATSVTNTKPLLGDGSMDFTFGGFAEIPIATETNYQFYLDGGAGYMYRSKGYSAAVPWSLLFKRYPTIEGLTFSLGARGNISFENDSTLRSNSQMESNRGAGGSYIISAYNPSWTLAQAAVGYQTKSNITYTMSGALPLAGKNSPDGFQVSLAVNFDFGDTKKSITPKVVHAKTFKQYDLEAKVLSTNDQLYLVKIDQGLDQGIEKGQIFDIFITNQAVAKAKVTNVKNAESVLRVLEYYKEQSIEVDAVAKRVVQDP